VNIWLELHTIHVGARNVRKFILRQAASRREQGTIKRILDVPPEVTAEVLAEGEGRLHIWELVQPAVGKTGPGAESDGVFYAVAGKASSTLKVAVVQDVGVAVEISTQRERAEHPQQLELWQC
jgi:hypothetical protein